MTVCLWWGNLSAAQVVHALTTLVDAFLNLARLFHKAEDIATATILSSTARYSE